MIFIRKPERIEIPNINYIDERREERHYLLLLGEEGGLKVDIERRRREITKEKMPKDVALRRLCGECSFLGSSLEAIRETPRRRVEFQEPLSAGLFELEEGYALILNMRGDSRVEYIDTSRRLVGVSVTESIHSLDPERGIVEIPEMRVIRSVPSIEEPIAFTDDEYEAIIVADRGIYIVRSGFPKLITSQRVRLSSLFFYVPFTPIRMLGEGIVLDNYIVRKRPSFTHALYIVSLYGEASIRKPGLVHLREHMSERPKEAIAARIERLGGVFDAEVFFDYTSLTARLSGGSRRDSFKLFEKIFELPSLRKEEELEKEKEAVLIEEARRSLSEPSGYVYTMLFNRMYGESCPLGRTYESIESSLEEVSLEDISKLHERAFGKESSFLMSIGNIYEIPEPLEMPRGEKPRYDFFEPLREPSVEELRGSHEGIAYVAMAAHIPGISDRESAIAALLERYLAAHIDSVLYEKLRLEKSLVYDIAAQMVMMRGLNVFTIEYESRPDKALEAYEEIAKTLEAIADGEIEEKRLEYSRNNLIGSMYRAYDELMSAGGSIIRNYVIRKNPFRELKEGERLVRSIRAEELIGFVDRFLRADRRFVEILKPKNS